MRWVYPNWFTQLPYRKRHISSGILGAWHHGAQKIQTK